MLFSLHKFQKRYGLTSSYIGPGIKVRRGEDRLSSLPDHLLYHILSFLTTEETVWASVLSSRWRYLWKWVPRLELVNSDFTDDKTCAAFIDEFLNSQGESYLREFKLCIDGENFLRDVSLYTPCIERVINRKIQRFQVENELGWWSSEIPLTLSVCEALVCLKLHCVRLNDFENLSLPCLKVMYLEDVVFPSDTAAEKLISCSPVLEDLKICLSKYDFVVVLRVRSMSLKSFTLKRVEPVYGRKYSVVIDTPRLEYLSLIDYQFQTFTVGSMSENVKGDVDDDFELDLYDVSGRDIIYNLLNNFSGVRDMAISWRTLKFICTLEDRDLLPKFRDLTRLRATMCSNVCLYVLPIVLDNCPNLKNFTLELIKDYPEGMIARLSTVLSRCLVSSLEYVEIESLITKKATELKLVKYFLKNSTTLKKLVLRLDKSSGENHEPGMLKKLIEYPRLSSSCQFEVLPVAPPPELPPGYIYVKPTTTRF